MTITDSISARDVIGFSHFCRFLSASLAALTCLPYKSLPTVPSVSHTVHALCQTDKNLLTYYIHTDTIPALLLKRPTDLKDLHGPIQSLINYQWAASKGQNLKSDQTIF